MSKKLKCTYFVLISLLFACSSNNDLSIPLGDAIEIDQQLELYCFYPLDEKYFDVEKEHLLTSWMREKTTCIEKSQKLMGNLFEEKGGGPNNAHWNPLSDLYITVNNYNSIDCILALNHVPVNFEIITFGNVGWMKVPYTYWIDFLVEDFSDSLQSNFETLIISVTNSEETIKKDIKVAFGE